MLALPPPSLTALDPAGGMVAPEAADGPARSMGTARPPLQPRLLTPSFTKGSVVLGHTSHLPYRAAAPRLWLLGGCVEWGCPAYPVAHR